MSKAKTNVKMEDVKPPPATSPIVKVETKTERFLENGTKPCIRIVHTYTVDESSLGVSANLVIKTQTEVVHTPPKKPKIPDN